MIRTVYLYDPAAVRQPDPDRNKARQEIRAEKKEDFERG